MNVARLYCSESGHPLLITVNVLRIDDPGAGDTKRPRSVALLITVNVTARERLICRRMLTIVNAAEEGLLCF